MSQQRRGGRKIPNKKQMDVSLTISWDLKALNLVSAIKNTRRSNTVKPHVVVSPNTNIDLTSFPNATWGYVATHHISVLPLVEHGEYGRAFSSSSGPYSYTHVQGINREASQKSKCPKTSTDPKCGEIDSTAKWPMVTEEMCSALC